MKRLFYRDMQNRDLIGKEVASLKQLVLEDADRYEAIRQRCLGESPYNKMAYDERFIACVGANGHYGQDTICDGFCDAVQILVSSLMSHDNFADSLVYPILYCVRHSLELYLKDVYNAVQFIYGAKTHRDAFVKLQRLLKTRFWVSERLESCKNQLKPHRLDPSDPVDETAVRKRLETMEKRQRAVDIRIAELTDECFKEAGPDVYTHDLKKLVEKIRDIYQVDERIPELFDPVLKYLTHYERIDPNGDAFRYLFSREGEPNLEKNKTGLVDLLTVGFQHEEMSRIFRNVQTLLYHLRQEYKTGTFTRDLSRQQLENISKMLPRPEEFADKIKEAKKAVKAQYDIGSNKFNEALAIIKAHREFSCNMGKELAFSSLSESTLKIFGECAVGIRDWETAAKNLHPNEICLLYTFSDISGWRYFDKGLTYYSEDLPYLYRVAKWNQVTLHDIRPQAEIRYVVEGMEKCGQKTYADILKAYR